MVALELEYLYQVKRKTSSAATVLQSPQHAVDLRQDDSSFAAVTNAATRTTWTHDPFDLIIAAQALVAGCPLLRANATIRQHLSCARRG
jgi:hypothetical protein